VFTYLNFEFNTAIAEEIFDLVVDRQEGPVGVFEAKQFEISLKKKSLCWVSRSRLGESEVKGRRKNSPASCVPYVVS
jgi:hypothetical protein